MNRILIYITLIGWAFFAAITPSCSDEAFVEPKPPVTDDDPFKDGKLPISLPVTRAINDGEAENKIDFARLIVIKNSIVTNNKMFTIGNHVAINDSVYIKDTIPVGKVDMFIIVNEKAEWGLGSITKESIYFPDNISKKTLTFPTGVPIVNAANPIPMYRQYRDLHISNEGVFTLAGETTPTPMNKLGEVDRLYAKLTLVLKAKFSEMVNGGDPIKIDSIAVKSMPKHSYLTPSFGLLYPVSGGYFNGAVHASIVNNLPVGHYTADGEGLSDSLIWYIPEHRLSDTTYLTYISVKASLKDNNLSSEQVEFKKIILGDSASTIPQDSLRIGRNKNANIPMTGWFITRNTHYKVNARIVSFDKMNESKIDVMTRVILWDQVDIGDTDIWEYKLKVSEDNFHFTGNDAFVGVITVETNYPKGWSATSPPTDGITFDDSSGTYPLSELTLQTGTQLRFRYSGTLSNTASIEVKAGPVVKKINLTRH